MSMLLALLACALMYVGRHDTAMVAAVLSLTFAVIRLRPGWLSKAWNSELDKAQSETLFSGSRDADD